MLQSMGSQRVGHDWAAEHGITTDVAILVNFLHTHPGRERLKAMGSPLMTLEIFSREDRRIIIPTKGLLRLPPTSYSECEAHRLGHARPARGQWGFPPPAPIKNRDANRLEKTLFPRGYWKTLCHPVPENKPHTFSQSSTPLHTTFTSTYIHPTYCLWGSLNSSSESVLASVLFCLPGVWEGMFRENRQRVS